MVGRFWTTLSRPDMFGFTPGGGSSKPRACKACGGPVKGPNIYGSGFYCSELCLKLRTPEEYTKYKWKMEQQASGSLKITPP